jgi:hypothetical protein
MTEVDLNPTTVWRGCQITEGSAVSNMTYFFNLLQILMIVRRVMHMKKVRQKIWTWGVQGGYYLSASLNRRVEAWHQGP